LPIAKQGIHQQIISSMTLVSWNRLSSLQLQYARPFTNSPINDGLVAFF
jgi:hypothetical protein